mgnify:CR=1 FL=1
MFYVLFRFFSYVRTSFVSVALRLSLDRRRRIVVGSQQWGRVNAALTRLRIESSEKAEERKK